MQENSKQLNDKIRNITLKVQSLKELAKIYNSQDLIKYLARYKNTEFAKPEFFLNYLLSKELKNTIQDEKSNLKKQLAEIHGKSGSLKGITNFIKYYEDIHPEFAEPKFFLPLLSDEFYKNISKKGKTTIYFLKHFNIQGEDLKNLLTERPQFNASLMNQLEPTFKLMELFADFNINISTLHLLHLKDIVSTIMTDLNYFTYEAKKHDKITPDESELNKLEKAINFFYKLSNTTYDGCKKANTEELIKKLENQIPLFTNEPLMRIEELKNTKDLFRTLSSITNFDSLEPLFKELKEKKPELYKLFEKELEKNTCVTYYYALCNIEDTPRYMPSAWSLYSGYFTNNNVYSIESVCDSLNAQSLKELTKIYNSQDLIKYLARYKNTEFAEPKFFFNYLSEELKNNIQDAKSKLETQLKKIDGRNGSLEGITNFIKYYKDIHPEFAEPKFFLPLLRDEFYDNISKKGKTTIDFLKQFNIQGKALKNLLTERPKFNASLMNQLGPTFKLMELFADFDINISTLDLKDIVSAIMTGSNCLTYKAKKHDKITPDESGLNKLEKAISLFCTLSNITYDGSKKANTVSNTTDDGSKKANTVSNTTDDGCKKANTVSNTTDDGCKKANIEELIKKLENQIPLFTKITNAFASLFSDCCCLCR